MTPTRSFLTLMLAALAASLGPAYGQERSDRGGQGQRQSAQTEQRAQTGQGAPGREEPMVTGVLLFVPLAFATDPNLAKGCWVSLFDRGNFSGEQVTIVGPASVPNLNLVMRSGDPDSVVVGPKAQVTAYDNDNYRDHSANLLPGQRLADLQKGQFGAFQDIESLRVTCAS